VATGTTLTLHSQVAVGVSSTRMVNGTLSLEGTAVLKP
jgi:hypothetical protein